MSEVRFKYIEYKMVKGICNSLNFVIENKKVYVDFLYYLNYMSKENEMVCLFENSEKLDFDKFCHFIPNLFDLNINSKRNINALYKILKNKYYEELFDNIKIIKDKCIEIINEISLDFEIELSSNASISSDDIFKILDVKFTNEENTLFERLIKYMKVVVELNGYKLICFNTLNSFFSEEEISNILKEASYLGVLVINFDNTFHKTEKKLFDKTVILDNDLCEI